MPAKIIEFMNQIEGLDADWTEKYALNVIYSVFQRQGLQDHYGFPMIGAPKHALDIVRQHAIIIDNANEIAFKLELDVKAHFQYILRGKTSPFTGAFDWLKNHEWGSNEIRRLSGKSPVKNFALGVKARDNPGRQTLQKLLEMCDAKNVIKKGAPNKRKQAELELKQKNAEHHKKMCEAARQKRYET